MKISISIVLVLLLAHSAAYSQSTTATISGTVADASGASVVGAHIVVTNITTNISHADTTNSSGLYTVPLLAPGEYRIEVSAQSFKQEGKTGIILQVGQETRLDFTLTVGQSSSEVFVTATPSLTDTQSAAVGTVIDNQKVVDMPLNGRQFYTLALLVPGVYESVPNSSLSFRGGMNVAGSNETSNYFTLDGFNNNDAAITGPSLRPSIDAIEEFKVYTGTYEAEFGHNTGGQIVVTTKSGGNKFHGDLYEFIRNSAVDAKNYFAIAQIPPLKRNDFGGTFGGPIIKNKSFFFFGYEGLRLRQGLSLTSTVPTTAMQDGIFSDPLHAPLGYSPNVIQYNPKNQTYSINPTAMTAAQGQAYAIGKALLAYYPAPTNSNSANGLPSQNYLFNGLTKETTNQFNLRLDHTFRPSDTLFVTLNYFHDPVITPNNPLCGSYTIPGFNCNADLTTQLYGGGYTHIFTANLINQLRLGYQRLRQPRYTVTSSNFDEEYGIPAFSGTPPANIGGVPTTSITGYAGFGTSSNLPQDRADNTYDYLDTLLWSVGRHGLKFGVEATPFQANEIFYLYGSGGLTFNGANSGDPIADALLGLPFIAINNIGPPKTDLRSNYYAAFAQDIYRVRKNLTLNYGLRWETFTPITSPNNLIPSFDPIAGVPYQVGTDGYPRRPYNAWNKGFAPRLGFSYQPTGKESTVIRGGFGIAYNSPTVENGFITFLFSPPIHSLNVFVGPSQLLPNPFVSKGAPTLTPAGVDRNFRPAQVNTWSVGVQQQLSESMMLDVSYLGSNGIHLPNSINLNQPTIISPGVISAAPYPQYGNISWVEAEGNSNYNSLQLKLEKRYRGGLSFLIVDTYGKSLDDVGLGTNTSGTVAASQPTPQNSHDLGAEYGRSDFDVRNRFVASPVYDLPFGKERAYLAQGLAGEILGNFTLTGIIATQTGTPSTPYLSSAFSGSETGNSSLTTDPDRPNLVPGQDPNKGPKSTSQWFNTAAFSLPSPGTFGNAGRNIIKDPGYTDVDVGLLRNFELFRKTTLQFRGEVFNVLNHPLLGLPGVTVNSVNATTGIANASSTFGPITSTQADSREIQLALKLLF